MVFTISSVIPRQDENLSSVSLFSKTIFWNCLSERVVVPSKGSPSFVTRAKNNDCENNNAAYFERSMYRQTFTWSEGHVKDSCGVIISSPSIASSDLLIQSPSAS